MTSAMRLKLDTGTWISEMWFCSKAKLQIIPVLST